ncbi:MBL fold metallo-hydrolase [Rhodobacter sp. SY28-1]|uniref:MBL fold metallo-hydrolase n=1 Tax=Rhodobacter sp. SY28-1 TaxID=2562317 RepID=UPI0010BF6ABD|nr:MBL fold metallo-hydrolase [Rhodobacter sp. SY28-1]
MRVVRETERSLTVELDDLSVTMLLDGETTMGPDCLRGPDGAYRGYAPGDLVDGRLPLPVRAFLVQGPDGCLLIDAGAGQAWHKGLGQLGAALAEAGSGPQEVTVVALTHTHIDHLSGLVDGDGGLAFPNAERVFVATEELMAFRAEPRMIPVLPRLVPLEQGDGPMPGVMAVNAPGHSPGHMAYLVEARLLIWGDLVHHPLQLAQPGLTWKYDENPDQARATRAGLFDRVLDEGWMVAGSHLPHPGIGRLERDGNAYVFHPVMR